MEVDKLQNAEKTKNFDLNCILWYNVMCKTITNEFEEELSFSSLFNLSFNNYLDRNHKFSVDLFINRYEMFTVHFRRICMKMMSLRSREMYLHLNRHTVALIC